MPRETVWMLRAALVHLMLGFALGGLALAAKEWPLGSWTAPAVAVHRDVVLIGWMLQVVVGVAYWMLPKYPHEPVRGRRWPVVAGAVLLNGGLAATAIGGAGGAPFGYFLIGGAGVLFVMTLAPRVKPFGTGRTV